MVLRHRCFLLGAAAVAILVGACSGQVRTGVSADAGGSFGSTSSNDASSTASSSGIAAGGAGGTGGTTTTTSSSGWPGACAMPADCPATGTVCGTPYCQEGSCGTKVAPKGLACNDGGGKVCDGAGTCVACNVDADCPAGDVCSGQHKCVPPTCTDGKKNGGETGVDCGGPMCPPCSAGGGCTTGMDCQSMVCVGGVCSQPTCSDGFKNGTETGVDCGGACPACIVGQQCAVDGDCITGRCHGGFCRLPHACAGILANDPNAADGQNVIDIWGDGAQTVTYCDMTGGGWTLVANQVPGDLLPDDQGDVGSASFGTLTKSWRMGQLRVQGLGTPDIAWKLTDASHSVYFKSPCPVNWSFDMNNKPASDCNRGYTSKSFITLVNGTFSNVASRGIGTAGSACNIRAYESSSQDPVPVGAMADCNFDTSEIVRLWYL